MADCEEEKFYAVTDTFGGTKPVPSCNPADERVPDELKEPKGSLVVPPASRLPNPVQLYNVKKALTCFDIYDTEGPDGDVYGPGAVVPDGYYTGTVELSLVSDITDEQLEYIAANSLTERLSVLFHEYTVNGTPKDEVVAGIALLLRITADKAALAYTELNNIQSGLDYEAYSMAASMLSCYWLNREASATCWDGISPEADQEFATYADHKDAVVEYFVPAGLLKSTISQADADRQAASMAVNSLNCFYVSDNVDVACTDPDRPGKPDRGGDVEVPVERKSVIAHMPPRNGNVVIPKGAYTSRVSRAAATKAARDYAYSLLVCYYFNDYVRRTCGLSEARGIDVDPLVDGPEVANIESKVSGQEAIVPYGSIVSYISPDDANSKAAYIAESLLECCYISPEVHVECPAVYVVDEHGNPVLEPDGKQAVAKAVDKEDYAVSSFTLPRGSFTGCVDKNLTSEETNEAVRQSLIDRANKAADLELSCIYCNKLVLPSCVPEWVIRAVTKGIELPSGDIYWLSLPLDPDNIINPYTGEKEDTSSWSKDATVGFKADYFCAEDYYTAQRLADSEGVELLATKGAAGKVDETCTFANCIVHAACMAENIYVKDGCRGATVKEGRYKRYYMETGERGEECGGGEYIWLTAKKFGAKCALSPSSNPPPCEYITVDPGTIKVTIAETPGTIPVGEPGYSYDENARKARTYANKLAMDLALSSVCCKQPPATVIGYCTSGALHEKTSTLHGVYTDMPIIHAESAGEVHDDRECVGCNRTFYVRKHYGLEQLVDYSPVEARPIVMDWTPEECFNADHYEANKEPTFIGKQMDLQDVIETVRSLVVCLYGNKEVEGWCSASEDIGSDDEPSEVISDYFKLPENTIVSDLWYNAQITAELLADSIVNCSYGNITVQAECSCNKGEYKNQLAKWEYLRQIVPFKCGKVKANTIFAKSSSLARRIALGLAELITVCRIKPCEDLTPFKVRYKCKPEDPCDNIKNKKKRLECKRKEKDREKDYSDCILRMNHGMVYLSNGTVVDCPCIEYTRGTKGKLSVRIKKEVGTGNYKCVHLVNGKEVEWKECSDEDSK